MSTLQYVGARYVPVFFKNPNGTAEWKANTYYEAMTIVYYNNSTYISRMPVPVSIGNPAENSNYWLLSGNYNGQIMAIQKSISDIESNDAIRNNNQIVYPEYFGAKGDGVTDDAPAIRKALQYCEKNKVNLAFNRKIYFVATSESKNTLFPLPSNFILCGNKAIIRLSSSLASSFIFANKTDNTVGGYSASYNITIKDLSIEGNQTQNTLIGFIHSRNVTIENCMFSNITGWHMVELNSCIASRVSNCHFLNYSGSEMLQIDSASDNNVFPGYGPWDGTLSREIIISNCNFELSDNGAAIGSHTKNQEAHDIVINNNVFRSLKKGCSFATMAGLTANNNDFSETNIGFEFAFNSNYRNINIKDNTYFTSNSTGKFITGTQISNSEICGNNITGTKGHMIEIGMQNTLVSNNNFLEGCDMINITGSDSAYNMITVNRHRGTSGGNIAFERTNINYNYLIGNRCKSMTFGSTSGLILLSNIIIEPTELGSAIHGNNVINNKIV